MSPFSVIIYETLLVLNTYKYIVEKKYAFTRKEKVYDKQNL